MFRLSTGAPSELRPSLTALDIAPEDPPPPAPVDDGCRFDPSTSTENGDYCAWTYGSSGVAYLDPPNNNIPISNIAVGGRSYLVQMNYNPTSGACVQGADPPLPPALLCPAGYQLNGTATGCIAVRGMCLISGFPWVLLGLYSLAQAVQGKLRDCA